MKKFLIVVSIFSSLYFLNGCNSSQKPATGFEDEIYVVADSLEFEELKVSLKAAFEVEINTPMPEKLFIIKRVSSDQIEKVKNKKNVVIVAPLKSTSGTAELLNSIINDDIKRRVSSDKDYIHYSYDIWAKNQLVAIITGNKIDDIDFKIEKNKDSLRTTFQKESDFRLKESLYNPKYEQKKVESKLLVDYGWIIYAHQDFKLKLSDKKEKFVWFSSSLDNENERSIFISWIDSTSYLFLTPDSVKTIRDRITKKFFENKKDSSYIVLIDSLVTTTEINFNGKFALYTQGLWKNTKNNSVGPFVNYLLYDDYKKRIYMLDGSVDAPKYYKRNLIQQVDIILQSFSTSYDLPQDRFDDLIDEYYRSFKK